MPDQPHELPASSGLRRVAGSGLILAAVCFLAAGCATTQPVPMRGLLHHTKSNLISTQLSFEVQPIVSTDGIFRLRLTNFEDKEFQLIEYYEKVMEYQGKGEMDPAKIRRVTVPGEYIEVQGEVQHKRQETSSLGQEKIKINESDAMLTAQGIFEDRTGLVLRFFDDLELGENTGMNLKIQVPKLGKLGVKTLILTRRQLMECLGVAWDAPTGSANNGLTTTVTPNATTFEPGAELSLNLTAENRGTKPVAKVMGRTFSRHEWLNGRNFYLGTLKPGEKRSAVRIFRVPTTVAGTGPLFVELALWDINKGDRMGEEVIRNFPLTFQVLPAARSP